MTWYKYRQNFIKTPVEITGKVIDDLIEQDGVAKPERLVEVSRPEDAPLHNEFEWNDDVAAEKWRCEQARQIIKNVIIIKTDSEKEREMKDEQKHIVVEGTRAFVSTGENKHEYVHIDTALANENWKTHLLESAKKDMISFRTKYIKLLEVSNVIDAIDDFLSA